MSLTTTTPCGVLQKIQHHTGDVTTCDFSFNSLLATGSGDKTVVVWEWKIGEGFQPTSYSPLLGHKYAVTCVRFAPVGYHLISSSVDGYNYLWDAKTGQCLHSFVQSTGTGVRASCFSSESTMFASAGEGGILCLWDLSNYSLIRTIDRHDEESIQGVSFSPDSMILATGDVTGSLKIWHVGSTKDDRDPYLTTIRDAHDLGINGIEFSSQYTVHSNEEGVTERTYILATCGNDHCIKLWQLTVCHPTKSPTGFEPVPLLATPPDPLATLRGHTSAVSTLRFSAMGDYIASTSIDKTARIWKVSSGKCLKTLEGHSRYVACCAFSKNNYLLVTGSNDKSVLIWDLTGNLDVSSQFGTPTSALHRGARNDGRNGGISESSMVKLFHKLEHHSSAINTCDFSSNFLATAGSDKTIQLWSWGEDGMLVESGTLDGHRYAVNQVEFSTNGELASCSLDGNTLIWDPVNCEMIKSGFHSSGSGVRCVRFSPDGTYLAVGGDDETAFVFLSESCDKIMTLEGHSEAVTCLAFSPDSEYLLTGCADGHARIYSMRSPSQNPIVIMENANDLGVTSADFSPITHTFPLGTIGKYEMATCGHDCLIKIWKFDSCDKSASTIWKLPGHGGTVTCVRYSPNLAELIASTATDKTCRLWDSYSGDCLHVLNGHTAIVTCCAFSPDSCFLVTGSMDKDLLIWELPKDLAFQSFVASRIRSTQNPVIDWSIDDVNQWLGKLHLPPANLTGANLIKNSLSDILDQLNIDDDGLRLQIQFKLESLRKVDSTIDTPNELLCPITHQLMRDPVSCSDGYTYERSAIEAWFNSGHLTSPMTNAILHDLTVKPNTKIRSDITDYLASLCKS